MTYTIVFEPDYSRILPAIIIDCRATIPQIKNQVGYVIKAYCDNQVALIGDNSIFYKIETEKGVIASVFSINVNTANKTAVLVINLVRPAFTQFNSQIQNIITKFIQNLEFQPDFLF